MFSIYGVLMCFVNNTVNLLSVSSTFGMFSTFDRLTCLDGLLIKKNDGILCKSLVCGKHIGNVFPLWPFEVHANLLKLAARQHIPGLFKQYVDRFCRDSLVGIKSMVNVSISFIVFAMFLKCDWL